VRRVRARTARIAALAALTLVACRPSSSSEDAEPLTLTASDVQLLGTSESIALVRDLEVLPDGSVWLLNSVEPLFIGFDGDGNLIDRHGSTGGGPDEFRMPAGLLAGGLDGEAWLFDFARHSFFRISRPGADAAQLALPPTEIPPGSVRGGMDLMSPTVRTARLGNEVIVPWTTATMELGLPAYRMATLHADLAALDPQAGSVRSFLTLGDVLDDPSAGFVATDGGVPLWYRLWAVCGDHLRVYDRVRNQLRGFTAAGEEMRPIELPPVRLTEVTPNEFARAVFPLRQAEVTGAVGTRLTSEDSVRVLNDMARELKGEPHELAAYLPRYVDFRCASDGTMWIQPIDLRVGGLRGGASWLRITPQGATREVRFPERFDALRFTSDRVWGVLRDELDVASVAWIEWPDGA
jgi:hypothetical protein